MKKILFIVPMHISFESFLSPGSNSRSLKKGGRQFNSLSTDLPIGVMSLSAYVKANASVETRLIDFNAEINALDDFTFDNYEDCVEFFYRSLAFQPDIVGVSSLFSPSFNNFMTSGEVARRVWPDSLVIGGGNIPTNGYQDILINRSADFFDALCYGEGEKALLGLVQSDDPIEYFRTSTSWVTRDKITSDALWFPKHDFIENLDEIPFLDYDICDLKKHAINQNLSSFHSVENPRGFHIMTSRGCPFLCTFCASHKTHGRKMRYYSLGRVEEDLRRLVADYDANTVVFQDDHLMADKERVYQILGFVGDLKLNSLYQNGLTLYALDRPMLEAFFKAGVRHLVLPVESGSEKVLKEQMRKPLKMKISERVALDCRDLGIYTNVNIIVGMPGETRADFEDSRRNLLNVHGNWFNIACASPLVGSEMHEIAEASGYIAGDTFGADYHVATINTPDFSAQDVQAFQYDLNLELNFVSNNDLRYGEWETALLGFENVIRLRPDHAFALFYAGLARFKISERPYEDMINGYLSNASSPFWTPYVRKFLLPTNRETIMRFYSDYQPRFATGLVTTLTNEPSVV